MPVLISEANMTGEYSIHALELGPMENFVYIIHDHASGTGAIVDPAWEVDEALALAQDRGIRITDILLTHSHHDHVNGIDAVLESTDAQIHLLKEESRFWGHKLAHPTLHHGGDEILLGNSTISILHTPGHTPGSACYRVGDDLIAGDTLFVFGCGRCDLAGGDPEQMHSTLRRLHSSLPETAIVHPGHNYAPSHPVSTIREQIEGNPFLHFEKREDFVKYRMQIHDRYRDTPYEAVSREQAIKALEQRR